MFEILSAMTGVPDSILLTYIVRKTQAGNNRQRGG